MVTLPLVKEFVSIKVSSFDHAALATSLTTKSADGWDVVGIVAVGSDVVAYLSRDTSSSSASSSTGSKSTGSTSATSSASDEPAGWASADRSDVADAEVTRVISAVTGTATASSTQSASSGTTPSVPADWYKDPSGRYEYRYWDGDKWTEHVSRGGTVHKDPPTP